MTACMRIAWSLVPTTTARSKYCILYTVPFWTRPSRRRPICRGPEGVGAVPLISTDLASAELIKYAANAFLATKISYINEIAPAGGKGRRRHCAGSQGHRPGRPPSARASCRLESGGADLALARIRRLWLPRQRNIAWPCRSWKLRAKSTSRQRERVVEKLLGELKILKGRTIGLLGLAFKPNTDDLREAPGDRYRAQTGRARLQGQGARSGGHE